MHTSQAEKVVRVAHTFYQARRNMMALWGDEYPKKVSEYTPYITGVMQKRNCDEIEAAKFLIDGMIERSKDASANAIMTAWIIAAAVEVAEPEEVEMELIPA